MAISTSFYGYGAQCLRAKFVPTASFAFRRKGRKIAGDLAHSCAKRPTFSNYSCFAAIGDLGYAGTSALLIAYSISSALLFIFKWSIIEYL